MSTTTTSTSQQAAGSSSSSLLPSSTIGGKYVVAITGLGLTLFVVFHLLGNLQIFLGREVMNHYAHFLKSNPELLWPVRTGLLVFFVVHVVMAIWLNVKSAAARPVGYVYRRQHEEATWSSRSMILSGLVILAFLIYHLLHFTVGHVIQGDFIDPDTGELWRDQEGLVDVYRMVILGFGRPEITVTYIIGQVFLGLHLWHAVPSMFQSLGINRPRWAKGIYQTGIGIALFVVAGNILIPLLVLLGVYPDPITPNS